MLSLIVVRDWKKLWLPGFTWGIGFLLFVFAYYLPLMLDPPSVMVAEPRVRFLLGQALSVPAVGFELLRYFAVHACLLFACYWLLSAIGRSFSGICNLKPWLGQFVFLTAGWLLMQAGNAWLFPLSNYSFAFQSVARPEWAPVLAGGLCLASLLVAWRACTRLSPVFLRVVGGAVLGGGLLGAVWVVVENEPASAGRNIIIVGVDSLSGAAFSEVRKTLPALDGLLAQGVEFERAYTPLGRTFPSWMSILTGKSPAEHGAVFNLRNMDKLSKQDLVSRDLQAQGYRTVFAIDERRFNNMDEAFGFDRVVGPKTGALDFVLQRVSDAPLSNLLLQSSFSEKLLPFSRVNTASHTNYDAWGFVDSVLRAVSGAQKLFLAVHFESAHFPFHSRHIVQRVEDENSFWARHVEALGVVDRQVALLMEGLKEQGVLDDALVIVLSDHGEGLGKLEAVTTRDGLPHNVWGFGHGVSLLSDHQSRIVLGVLDFKNGKPVTLSRVERGQVSLLDLRSMIEAYSSTGKLKEPAVNKCVVVETGIRFKAALNYETLTEAELAVESAGFYEIDNQGRLRLREDRLKELVVAKDVGWRCRDRLTYYSQAGEGYYSYSLDVSGVPGKELDPPQEDIAQIEAYRRRLLEAL